MALWRTLDHSNEGATSVGMRKKSGVDSEKKKNKRINLWLESVCFLLFLSNHKWENPSYSSLFKKISIAFDTIERCHHRKKGVCQWILKLAFALLSSQQGGSRSRRVQQNAPGAGILPSPCRAEQAFISAFACGKGIGFQFCLHCHSCSLPREQ